MNCKLNKVSRPYTCLTVRACVRACLRVRVRVPVCSSVRQHYSPATLRNPVTMTKDYNLAYTRTHTQTHTRSNTDTRIVPYRTVPYSTVQYFNYCFSWCLCIIVSMCVGTHWGVQIDPGSFTCTTMFVCTLLYLAHSFVLLTYLLTYHIVRYRMWSC